MKRRFLTPVDRKTDALETDPSRPMSCAMSGRLSGSSILVVDDEPLIAMDVSITVEDAGGTVIGPVGTVEDALAELDAVRVDAAVLDVDLGSGTCEGIARRLEWLGTPFILHTGNAIPKSDLLVAMDVPVVRKPAHPETLLATLLDAMDDRGTG